MVFSSLAASCRCCAENPPIPAVQIPGTTSFDDWSDRSIHPDTNLDRYIDIDIALGRDVMISDATTLNLHGGFQYTNTKWTAYGGSYVYSSTGFRADVGTFPDGEKAISFEQRLPGVFLGVDATSRHGDWTISSQIRGGITMGAYTVDHHWMRDLRFDDDYGRMPFVSIGVRADHRLSKNATLFLGGRMDKYFHRKGYTEIYEISTGTQVAGPFMEGAGTDLTTFQLNAGLDITF